MPNKLKDPVEHASGKIFGKKSHYSQCHRSDTGTDYPYYWDPAEHPYEHIPERDAASRRLGDASLIYGLVTKNPALVEFLRKEHAEHLRECQRHSGRQKRYATFRGFVIGRYYPQLRTRTLDDLAAEIAAFG